MTRSDRGARFKRRALKRGYKVDEVDEFLDRCEATLAGDQLDDPVAAADVRDIVFRTRWGGYDEWQVDLHLDRLERELAELIDGGASIRGSNGFPTGTIERAGRPMRELPPGPSARERDPELEREASRGAGERYAGDSFSEGFADFADVRHDSRFPPDSYDEPLRDPTAAPPPAAPLRDSAAPRPGGFAELPPGRGAPPPVNTVASPLDTTAMQPAAITPPPSSPAPHYVPGGRVANAPSAGPTPGPTSGPPASPPRSMPAAPSVEPVSGAAGLDPYAGRHGKGEMTMEIPAYSGNVSPFTAGDKSRFVELRSSLKVRRFGSGYDPQQVDRLFDAITAAMEGQSSATVTPAEFDPSQFGLVQGGYFEDEVEGALNELRELFSRRLG